MSSQEAQAAEGRRSLRWWHQADAHGEMLRLSGRLAVAEGAVVTAAVSRLAEGAAVGPDGLYEPFDSRCADALVELASARLGADADADRATVVLHVDTAALGGGQGRASLADGTPLALDTVRRLACDARAQVVAEDEDGLAVGVGRTRRIAPASLARVVLGRDLTCRFPACERRRLLQSHHLVHWIDGGPTDADNLVILCRYHHRLVHELGWEIRGSPNRTLRFFKPDGQMLESSPPGLRPEVRQRLFGADGRQGAKRLKPYPSG